MNDQRELTPPPGPPRRHMLDAFLMIVGGAILLLPGACVLAYFTPPVASGDLMIWLACMAVSAYGVFLIVTAFRKPRFRDVDGGPGGPDDFGRPR